MFEDILDGFKDLEDELEKTGPDPGIGEEDPGNILSLDAEEEWDTGKDDNWDTGKGGSNDRVWGV